MSNSNQSASIDNICDYDEAFTRNEMYEETEYCKNCKCNPDCPYCMNKTYIIKLTDGGLVSVYSNDYHYGGCETCDYGSEYINELTLVLAKHTVRVTFNQMYNYGLSASSIIKMFAGDFSDMTEDEFICYIKLKCEENGACQSFKVSDK